MQWNQGSSEFLRVPYVTLGRVPLVDKVQEWSKKFSLTINIGKSQVQVISKDNTKINIKIDDKVLEQVDSFIYLGGVITNMASSEGDIKGRIGLAMSIMQKLNSIWKSSEITTLTKLEIYRFLVLSIATYGCETWTLKKKMNNDCLSSRRLALKSGESQD